MKKLILFLFVIFFSGCSNQAINEHDEYLGDQVFKESQISYAVVNLSCTGNCPNGRKCRVRTGPWGYAECDCEGCVLNVEIIDRLNNGDSTSQILSYFGQVEKFINYLDTLVYFETGEEEYMLDNIEFGYGEDFYFIIYEYITSQNQNGSVMYLSSDGKKYEIDCHGSCDDPDKTCRERYIFDPPSAECTCESDNCKMIVKEL